MNNSNTCEVLKSLADNTRLALVRRLSNEGCEVAGSKLIDSCSKAFQLTQPTLSHHFAKLVQSGVFLDRKSGAEKYYRLNVELLQTIGIDPSKL